MIVCKAEDFCLFVRLFMIIYFVTFFVKMITRQRISSETTTRYRLLSVNLKASSGSSLFVISQKYFCLNDYQTEDILGDDYKISSAIGQLKTQFWLFVRLFVVMGITWISEFVHVLIHGDHRDITDCNYYFEVKFIVTHNLRNRF